MNNKNGEPAFPESDGQTGITLRDYLAAKAMQGFCVNENDLTPFGVCLLAEHAYKVADAMLAEREKMNEGN